MKKVGKVILLLLLVTMAIGLGIFCYERFSDKKEPMESLLGDWVSETDISKEVAANAEVWLEEIEGVKISTLELEQEIGPLLLEMIEHYEIDEDGNAVYLKRVSRESYDECVQKAYEGMVVSFEKVIEKRFEMAGLERTDEESVETLFEEVFGMTIESYLKAQMPELVPTYEEVSERYASTGRKQVAE